MNGKANIEFSKGGAFASCGFSVISTNMMMRMHRKMLG